MADNIETVAAAGTLVTEPPLSGRDRKRQRQKA